MHRLVKGSTDGIADAAAFIETVRSRSDLFTGGGEIFITRAPGRLDVMGGIADYSGSLVLEMPTSEATFAALQKDSTGSLKITSLAGGGKKAFSFEMPLSALQKNGEPISYGRAREFFRRDTKNHWAAYVFGAFLVLMREKGVRFSAGARILIESKVPQGKGVSSSAALEVSVMNAVCAAFDISLDPREVALLCQKVENLVVGAPCGVMDQMSSNCGEADKFLSMICQPAQLRDPVEIPGDIAFWGIDSGIRHSVGSGDYGAVRTGAFMGYRIIADVGGLEIFETETSGRVRVEDPRWNGYLSNISPAEFEADFAAHLPQHMSGAEFLERYRGITDTVTRVEPEKIYPVLKPAGHPVYENARVHRFAQLLNSSAAEDALIEMGELMYGSHESYSACGLGSTGTDLLVELVKRADGLYGAKITGGGSGGTVAVLGRKGAKGKIEKIAEEYEKNTGHKPYIFSGSSMGAASFGHLVLRTQ